MSEDQARAFETGVRYQVYHAIVLLIFAFDNGQGTHALHGKGVEEQE
ncbi:MAG: DUF423 domain-containing protein [Robiginitalea sp.]